MQRGKWRAAAASKGPINRAELRARDLPAQELELVAYHQQLDVFRV